MRYFVPNRELDGLCVDMNTEERTSESTSRKLAGMVGGVGGMVWDMESVVCLQMDF